MRALPRRAACIVGAGVAACLAVGAPAAQALVQSAPAAGDPQTTYTIDGNTLTIQSSDPVFLEFIRGSTLEVTCSQARTRHLSGPFFLRWGEQADSITFHYPYTIPRVSECRTVWYGGGAHPLPYSSVVSVAPFTRASRRLTASMLAPGPFLARDQLDGEWLAIESSLPARYLKYYGLAKSLPSARALVRLVHARLHRAGFALRYARTVAGVRLPGVPYVIGRRTSTQRIELAMIGLDGHRYAYRQPVGRYGGGKFGSV